MEIDDSDIELLDDIMNHRTVIRSDLIRGVKLVLNFSKYRRECVANGIPFSEDFRKRTHQIIEILGVCPVDF